MSTKQLSPEKLAQLARARELAEVARQRIRNLSDGEKADHLRAKAEALQIGRPNTFFSCKTKLPRSRPSACRGFRNRFVLEETAAVERWRVPMARDRSRESVHERYWSPSRAAVARHTAQLGHSRACRSKARLTGRNMRSLQPFGASGTG